MTEAEYKHLQMAIDSHYGTVKKLKNFSCKEMDVYRKAVLACLSVIHQEYNYRLKEDSNND